MTTSSLSGNIVVVGVGDILPLPSLSPKELSPGKTISISQQSVSLGRSTTVNVAAADDEATGLSFASGSGSGVSHPISLLLISTVNTLPPLHNGSASIWHRQAIQS